MHNLSEVIVRLAPQGFRISFEQRPLGLIIQVRRKERYRNVVLSWRKLESAAHAGKGDVVRDAVLDLARKVDDGHYLTGG